MNWKPVNRNKMRLDLSFQEVVHALWLARGCAADTPAPPGGESHCFHGCILAQDQSLSRTKPKA